MRQQLYQYVAVRSFHAVEHYRVLCLHIQTVQRFGDQWDKGFQLPHEHFSFHTFDAEFLVAVANITGLCQCGPDKMIRTTDDMQDKISASIFYGPMCSP